MRLFKQGGLLSLVVAAAALFAVTSFGVTEETPIGSVAGTVKMSENGSPLGGVSIILTPLNPDDTTLKPRATFSDKLGNFSIAGVAVGNYKIEASAKVHELKPVDVNVMEGGVTHLDLQLDPQNPYLSLYTSQRVFMPDETPQVEAHGFGTDQKLAVKVYKIDLSKFLAKGSIYGVLYSISNTSYYNNGDKQDPSHVGKLVDSFTYNIKNFDAEGAFMDVVDLKKLDEGFYWVACDYGEQRSGALLSISQLALVTKSSTGDVLSYVTDLKTGKPQPGVQLSYNDKGAWKPFAKTDSDGLAKLSLPGKGRKLLVLASRGASQAVSAFYLYGGAADSNPDAEEGDEGYDEGGGPSDSNTTVFVYSDRPIYRPGDEVFFKGFARRRVGSQYNLPGAGTVQVELRDVDDNLVKSFTVPMDANGAFHGSYKTNEEDAPGQYTFTFHALGQQETLFYTLAAYRKPEFTIKVTWSKPRYTMGEKMVAKVKCEYYFGGPVVGAKVDASLYRNEDWYSEDWDSDDYDPDDGYDESQDYVGGDFVDQGSATTDANGEATMEFEPKPEKLPENYSYTPNYQYTLSASVTEAGDKYFEGHGSVKVSQGAVDLKVEPDDYIVTPGKAANVTVTALKSDDESPAAGQQVQIIYGTESWSQRNDIYSAKWSEIFTPEGRLSLTTGLDGTAHFAMPANHAGSYLIKATAYDNLGNTIKQQGYVYAGTDDFVPPPTSPDLAITLDKKLYKAGDTCKVLLTTKKPGATVLLTLEAEHVMLTKVVNIDKQSKLVDIPVDVSYLPRITVSAVAIQDKQFLQASEVLKIDVSARTLKLDVSSDKAQYLPGATATYHIHATGADGKPAAADLSLGIVDEAIYALQQDNTNPIRSFYPARPDRVSTNYSFPELYLDGGDKGGDIPVRINFKDTAAWLPSIRTDAEGNATAQIKLPDNLTQWRATVIGVSDATDVGMTTYDVVVNKPLMIRLEGPKFIVNGDTQEIAAVVNNNTGADATVHVSLQPNGFSTADALNQTITVVNNQSTSITWNLRATQSGPGTLVAKAWIDGGPNDGVQQNIDIKSHAREVDFRTAGDIKPDAKLDIARRSDADPNAGRLKITVSPTLGTGVYDSLDQLIDYPYGCVEQTMSRFLPAMIASQSLKQVGLLRPDLAKKVPTIAQQSLLKIKNMQHADGGWGWWEFDSSDGFMTAYVLDGLKFAKAAGYNVSPFMTDHAVDWGSKEILSAEASKWPKRDRLYLACALAEYGKKDVAAKVLNKVDLTGESAAVVAVAAMVADELGPKYADQRDKLLEQVRNRAVEDVNTAHWEPKIYPHLWWWWEYDDVYGAEVSALPLLALERISPDDPIIEKGVRGLLLSRQGDWWWSTRDSSFALMAIAWYLKKEGAPVGPSTVRVLLNGNEVAHLDMNIQNLRGLSPSFEVPIGQLKQGQNTVELKVEGASVSYYTVDFSQYATAPTLGKLVNNSGMTIERSYHLLRAQQMENGTLQLKESPQPVDTIKSGELVQCDLVITTDHDRNYVMITDPIPSNCHPETRDSADYTDDNPWDYWYAEQAVYDDRLTFFSTHMDAGRHTISYVLRAESPGVAHVLPPVAGNMYNPSDVASDSERQLVVTP